MVYFNHKNSSHNGLFAMNRITHELSEVYLIVIMIEKMVFKHVIGSYSLHFEADSVLETPFQVEREKSFFHV